MNFSLFTSVLVFSLLITVLVPFAVFAAPIFESDTVPNGTIPNFFFEPEQSITNPLYFDNSVFVTQITDLDVVVRANASNPEIHEVFVTFLDQRATDTVYLAYTNNLITSFSGAPYFVNSFNTTQTVVLSENNRELSAVTTTVCNIASQPKVAATDSHVFVTWIDQTDAACSTPGGEKRIAESSW